ncbi:MAG: DUF2513 domain-containing protein [Candidatus Methanoculleus thermohydrogenotrophicum]|jgi:DNA-binding transcriptional ArsR family regulator|nr:DUF2513 domain-containing protein [Candidatus Methanoculleus thermohydrogenotrophicum]
MKREPDLIRKILFKLEDDNEAFYSFGYKDVPIEGYSPEEVYYHLNLMMDAGLVHTESFRIGKFPSRHVVGLSWRGQDLLDYARDDALWSQAVEIATTVGSGSMKEIIRALENLSEERIDRHTQNEDTCGKNGSSIPVIVELRKRNFW